MRLKPLTGLAQVVINGCKTHEVTGCLWSGFVQVAKHNVSVVVVSSTLLAATAERWPDFVVAKWHQTTCDSPCACVIVFRRAVYSVTLCPRDCRVVKGVGYWNNVVSNCSYRKDSVICVAFHSSKTIAACMTFELLAFFVLNLWSIFGLIDCCHTLSVLSISYLFICLLPAQVPFCFLCPSWYYLDFAVKLFLQSQTSGM